MKHFVKSFWIQLAAFIAVIATLWVVYAAWNDTVNTGDPLSSANWNTLVWKVKDMDDVLNFSWGNIWVGTASPQWPLHIRSDGPYIALEDTDDTNGSYGAIHSYQDGGLYYDANRNNSATSGSHHFRVDGANERMTILNNGNIGIGEVTPGSKLHVDGNIQVGDTSDIIYTNNLNTMSSSADMAINYSAADLIFNSDYGENMRIDRDGNVWIGTTNPSGKLEITWALHDKIVLRTGSDTVGDRSHIKFVDNSWNLNGYILSGVDGTISINNGSGQWININSSGEVGIESIASDGTGKVVCMKWDGNVWTCANAPNASGVCTCN